MKLFSNKYFPDKWFPYLLLMSQWSSIPQWWGSRFPCWSPPSQKVLVKPLGTSYRTNLSFSLKVHVLCRSLSVRGPSSVPLCVGLEWKTGVRLEDGVERYPVWAGFRSLDLQDNYTSKSSGKVPSLIPFVIYLTGHVVSSVSRVLLNLLVKRIETRRYIYEVLFILSDLIIVIKQFLNNLQITHVLVRHSKPLCFFLLYPKEEGSSNDTLPSGCVLLRLLQYCLLHIS